MTNLKTFTTAHLVMPAAEPTPELGIISPAVAKELATTYMAPNRTYSKASGDAYLTDMLAGRWMMNGDPIRFDTDGKVIDGQHRLAAVAQLPATHEGLPFLVVRGVEREAQDTMDAGRKRSYADQINIGVTEPTDKLGTKVVAALRALHILATAPTGKAGGGRLTNAQLKALHKLHPDIVASVKFVAKADGDAKVLVRPAVVAAIHYASQHFIKGAKGKGNAFVEVLRTGVATKDYKGDIDPAYALYVKWNNLTVRATENEALKYIATAWALYENGDTGPKAFKLPAAIVPIEGLTLEAVTGEAQPVAEAPKVEATAAKPKGGKKAAKATTTAKGKAKATAEAPKATAEAAKPTTAPKASREGNSDDTKADQRNLPLADRVALAKAADTAKEQPKLTMGQ